MSLSDKYYEGLSAPLPVAGAGLPIDLTPYAGDSLEALKQHKEKYKQLARMQRLSDSQSKKMLANLEASKYEYDYPESEDSDMDKVSFVSSDPVLRRLWLEKIAQRPNSSTQQTVTNNQASPTPADQDDIVFTDAETEGEAILRDQGVAYPSPDTSDPNYLPRPKIPTSTPRNNRSQLKSRLMSRTLQPQKQVPTPAPAPTPAPTPAPKPAPAPQQSRSTPTPAPSKRQLTMDEIAEREDDIFAESDRQDRRERRFYPRAIPRGSTYGLPLDMTFNPSNTDKEQDRRNLERGIRDSKFPIEYDDTVSFNYLSEDNRNAYRTRLRNTTPFRKAQLLRDVSLAAEQQRGQDPVQPPRPTVQRAPTQAPAPERSYLDRAKGFFSRVGDSLEGMGTRAIRQGTQGLQQLGNYALRNVDFLDEMVDDSEEARILGSLIQGSRTEADRAYYTKQLEALADRKANKGYNLGRFRNYDDLREAHLLDQARVRAGEGVRPEQFLADNRDRLEKDYGQGFDQYYGRGAESQRLGIRPLEQDSFGTMFTDMTTAFRRAKQDRPVEDQVATDPKQVAETQQVGPVPLQRITNIDANQLSPSLVSNLEADFGIDINEQGQIDVAKLGEEFNYLFNAAGNKTLPEQDRTEAIRELERGLSTLTQLTNELPPAQTTRLLVSMNPDALNIGNQLMGMTDEEAERYILRMNPIYADQVVRFADLTSGFLMPRLNLNDPRRDFRTGGTREGGVATPKEVAQHGGFLDTIGSYLPFTTQYYRPNQQDKIDTEIFGTSMSSSPTRFYRVPDASDALSTLYYNPTTGEFNREYLGSPSNMEIEDLPDRFRDKFIQDLNNSRFGLGSLI